MIFCTRTYGPIFSPQSNNRPGPIYYFQCEMESGWVRGQTGAACAHKAGRSLEIVEPWSKELDVFVCTTREPSCNCTEQSELLYIVVCGFILKQQHFWVKWRKDYVVVMTRSQHAQFSSLFPKSIKSFNLLKTRKKHVSCGKTWDRESW